MDCTSTWFGYLGSLTLARINILEWFIISYSTDHTNNGAEIETTDEDTTIVLFISVQGDFCQPKLTTHVFLFQLGSRVCVHKYQIRSRYLSALTIEYDTFHLLLLHWTGKINMYACSWGRVVTSG